MHCEYRRQKKYIRLQIPSVEPWSLPARGFFPQQTTSSLDSTASACFGACPCLACGAEIIQSGVISLLLAFNNSTPRLPCPFLGSSCFARESCRSDSQTCWA